MVPDLALVPFHNKETTLTHNTFHLTEVGSAPFDSNVQAHGLLVISQNSAVKTWIVRGVVSSQSEFEKENFEMSENRMSEGLNTPNTGGNTGTGTATALSQTAQDYGHKISGAASQAKDYVTDKVGVVGDKIKELQNADLGEIAANAKDYARKNPGQAILISAAAGLVLGLILRGRRN